MLPPAVLATDLGRLYAPDLKVRELLAGAVTSGGWWAIRNVSFQLLRGESLALLGPNGAGKSTLLRMVAGVLHPTSGAISVRGTLGRLLSLGAGTLDDLSGLENARMALRLSGNVERALSRVSEFSGLGSALSRPLRTYSAGMRLRLAYATAIAADPNIIVADEVLGVGDEEFQQRCAHFVTQFLERGGILLFATHNLYLAEKLCSRALWLDKGQVVKSGPAHIIVRDYRDAMSTPVDECGLRSVDSVQECAFGERLTVDLTAWSRRPNLELRILSPAGIRICTERVPVGVKSASVVSTLLPGMYFLTLVENTDAGERLLSRRTIVSRGKRRELGSVFLPNRWSAHRATSSNL